MYLYIVTGKRNRVYIVVINTISIFSFHIILYNDYLVLNINNYKINVIYCITCIKAIWSTKYLNIDD